MITVATTAALSLVFRQDVATELMASLSTISATAVLLPLAAGAAGALHLSQGEGNSLVSGAATGMLIAASLAPPAGLIGMALVSGDIEMLPSATFLLGLQLVGINLAAAIVFRLHGLRPEGVRYTRGRRPVRAVSLLLSALGLAALLAWQFGSARPELRRATVEQRLRGVVMEALSRDSSVALVEANLRFTRASIPGQNSLLVVLYLQRQPGNSGDEAAISRDVTSMVTNAIADAERNVEPLIDVTLLSP